MSIEADSAATPHARPEDLLAHAAWVRGVATALVRDAASVDDLVQETWLAAMRRPPETDRPLRPWLAGVVRNLVRQRRRGEARRERREEVVATRRAAESLPTPDELAERLDTQQRLAAHVKKLPEPFRATVLLRYYEGLTAADIASREGVPAGTVRWRLKRALQLLRERLDAEHDGDRRAWCMALIPLTVPDTPSGSGAGTGLLAAAVQGVLAMSAFTKLMMGGAAALVTAALLAASVHAVLGGNADEPAPAEPVEVSFRPEIDDRTERRRVAVGDETSQGTDAAANVTSDGSPIEPEAPPAIVEGRALDENGTPLADIDVRALDFGRVETRTAGDGTFRLEMQVPDLARRETLMLRGLGRETVRADVPVTRGETTFAGDISMRPGGTVSGRVIDADGLPVQGAWVGPADDDEAGMSYASRRRLRRSSSHGRNSALTDAEGRFTVRGVRAGTRRMWAGGDDYLGTLSGPFEVRAATESFGVEIVLERFGDDDLIEGRVVSPDGRPVPEAKLRYRYSGSWGRSGSGSMSVDRDGAFRLVISYPGDYGFSATDPEGRWGGVSVEDVQPGTRDLVLRLPENAFFDLRVTDRGGAPVGGMTIALIAEDAPTLLDHLTVEDAAGGGARLRIPGQEFRIEIEADGYHARTLGPFAPNAIPDGLTTELDAVPTLRGRVMMGDEPVVGAEVAVHELVPKGRRIVHNGFGVLRKPTPSTSATTDSDGRYEITLRSSGRFVARVTKDGLAPADSGRFDFDTALGRAGIDVSVQMGGAIEGVVGGDSPAGTIVGISRGDGFPASQRVGPDGRYRFEGLTPGPWEVRRIDQDIIEGNSSTTFDDGTFTPRWSCRVAAGETTRYDLGAANDVRAALEVRVVVDGDPAVGWAVALIDDAGSMQRTGGVAQIGERGSVTVKTDEAGAYRVLVRSPESDLTLMREVELQTGSNAVEIDLQLGAVTVTNVPEPQGDAPLGMALVWFGDDGWTALVPLDADDGGVSELTQVPVGAGRIARFDPGSASPDVASWPVVRQFDVSAGATVEIELDGE
jgi:RNA polymerase sigma-70 factor (ECF subfamily)